MSAWFFIQNGKYIWRLKQDVLLTNMWLPWFLFAPILGLLPIHTLTHRIPSRSELGSCIPPYLSYLSNLTNHTLAFLPFPPPMPGLRWRNPQLSHITLRPGGGGRIYTPYNYIWKPSRSWFGEKQKVPVGRLHIMWPRFYTHLLPSARYV